MGKKRPLHKTRRKIDPTTLIKNKEYSRKTGEGSLNIKTLEELTTKLKSIAEELAPINPRKKHEWWNEECDQAIERRHQAWINHQAQKSEESNLELIKQRKSTQKIIRQAKRKHLKSILLKTEEKFNKKQSPDYYKTFGRYLKKYEPPTLMLRDKSGHLAHNNQENAEILAEVFNKLLN